MMRSIRENAQSMCKKLGDKPVFNGFFWLGLILCTPIFASNVPLLLIEKIPVSSLSVKAPKNIPYVPFSYGKHGFINAGESVYFGDGCWTFDLKIKSLKCDLPASLGSVNISEDARWLFGCIESKEGKTNGFWLDTVSSTRKEVKVCTYLFLQSRLDRSGRFLATPIYTGAYFTSVTMSYLGTNKSIDGKPFKGGQVIFREFLGFSTDGKSLLFFNRPDEIGIVDAKTLKFRSAITPPFVYIVAGHSGSVVAGLAAIVNPDTGDVPDFKEKSMTSVWDLKQRKYLWKEKNWGEALAFSPDDQYLLTRKHVVNLKTGEIVGSNYIGKEGKISPDNKTLLTKDDQFFYIYKIGKD